MSEVQTQTQTQTGEAPAPTVRAAVTYHLSEAGRRASLLAGGDGRQQQVVTIDVPAEHIDLVAVDTDGRATADLALWPVDEGHVTLPPEAVGETAHHRTFACLPEPWRYRTSVRGIEIYFSAPLTPERALQLLIDRERLADDASATLIAQCKAEDVERREAEIARVRADIEAAEAAAAETLRSYGPTTVDVGGRAVTVITDTLSPDLRARGEAILKRARDLDTERKVAREAAAEAKRLAEEAAIQAKREFVEAWVRENGTPNQLQRLEAGLLPEEEALTEIMETVFGLVSLPRYRPITAQEIRDAAAPDHPCTMEGDDEDEDGDSAVKCHVKDATEATAAQWDALQTVSRELSELEPVVKLRRHRCWLAPYDNAEDPEVERYGIHVKLRHGPLSLVREFAAPDK